MRGGSVQVQHCHSVRDHITLTVMRVLGVQGPGNPNTRFGRVIVFAVLALLHSARVIREHRGGGGQQRQSRDQRQQCQANPPSPDHIHP